MTIIYNLYYASVIYDTKKRDRTVAVPLLEALVLPLHPNKQHRVHADMYNHEHTYLQRARIRIYISRGHQNAAMCWMYENLPDSK